ncbi:unnamed protein product, partial [Rhizoctonia solani]
QSALHQGFKGENHLGKSASGTSKRPAQAPPTGEPAPKKGKKANLNRGDLWGAGLDQELQNLQAAAAANQKKTRKKKGTAALPANEAVPVTTRAAKSELVDEVDMQVGEVSAGPKTQKSTRNTKKSAKA